MGRRSADLFRFVYDAVTGDYVDLNGVKPDQELILDAMMARITESKQRITAAYQAAINGQMTAANAQALAITELRNINVQLYALGRGGFASMTPADYTQASQLLQTELQYFRDFSNQMIAGELSQAQIEVRLNQYGNHAWQQFWTGKTAAMERAGFSEERRLAVDDGGTCEDCRGYEAQGWQKLGSLPEPGQQSVCHANCRCMKEYR